MAFTTIEEMEAFGDKITVEHGFKFNVDAKRAKWTGWKYGGSLNDGFCAQLVWYKRDTSRVLYGYYVNMPGMQSGKFMPGACFDIGDQRVRQDTPLEELDAMIDLGWEQLVELVKKEEGIDISNLREGFNDVKPSEVPQDGHRAG
jgi:hypothetical protein